MKNKNIRHYRTITAITTLTLLISIFFNLKFLLHAAFYIGYAGILQSIPDDKLSSFKDDKEIAAISRNLNKASDYEINIMFSSRQNFEEIGPTRAAAIIVGTKKFYEKISLPKTYLLLFIGVLAISYGRIIYTNSRKPIKCDEKISEHLKNDHKIFFSTLPDEINVAIDEKISGVSITKKTITIDKRFLLLSKQNRNFILFHELFHIKSNDYLFNSILAKINVAFSGSMTLSFMLMFNKPGTWLNILIFVSAPIIYRIFYLPFKYWRYTTELLADKYATEFLAEHRIEFSPPQQEAKPAKLRATNFFLGFFKKHSLHPASGERRDVIKTGVSDRFVYLGISLITASKFAEIFALSAVFHYSKILYLRESQTQILLLDNLTTMLMIFFIFTIKKEEKHIKTSKEKFIFFSAFISLLTLSPLILFGYLSEWNSTQAKYISPFYLIKLFFCAICIYMLYSATKPRKTNDSSSITP